MDGVDGGLSGLVTIHSGEVLILGKEENKK